MLSGVEGKFVTELRRPKINLINIVTSAVCSSVAIASTLIRLYIRRNRLWADDAWACFSMMSLIVQVVAVFLHSSTGTVGVTRYYLMAVTFYTIIWSARLSLLFSIIRIDPCLKRRAYLLLCACIFIVTCILLISQVFWVCEPKREWKRLNPPQCHLEPQVALFQLTSDVLADATLLLTPIILFRILSDKWLRYRLVAIFSTCIITTILSLVHAVFIIRVGGWKSEIVGLVEDCTSLIVCNIPVIASAATHLGEGYAARRVPRSLSSVSCHVSLPVSTVGSDATLL
ncbi:hypothetical protein AMATHDRAFT_143737 [Amanita thiersii Skay4041]|uniref:Integral membrane protein n=1 Tax=Amanita thiersii Skay4041 TaxID=703135 RepID=A0A2A9NT55_9AGAR|nr:hypothetical protein AMATHDRAFT_143737 [Amanita thiersii Skay4041]